MAIKDVFFLFIIEVLTNKNQIFSLEILIFVLVHIMGGENKLFEEQILFIKTHMILWPLEGLGLLALGAFVVISVGFKFDFVIHFNICSF